MRQAIVLFVHLVVVWLLLSGHYDAGMIGFGLLSAAIVVLLTWHLGVLDRESLPVHLGLRVFVYIPWLIKEVVKANIDVARIILDPALPISPRLIRLRASQKSEVAQVIFANSITLTPGTITLDLRDGSVLVHALTESGAADLQAGEMDARVAALEGVGSRG
jgi:multicomponent Na+:H+ antiporter subunit E